MKSKLKILLLILFYCFSSSLISQDANKLSLDQALEKALNDNQLIKIFQHRILGSEGKLKEMKSHYYPRIVIEGTMAYNSDPNIYIRKGELNGLYDQLIDNKIIDDWLKENAPLPPKKLTFLKGSNLLYKTNGALYQPLSQLTTVNTGKKIAKIDVEISKLEYENLKSEISLGVKELFYGILIQDEMVNEALHDLEYTKAEYQDAVNAYEAGELLYLEVTALKAEVFEKEQDLLNEENIKEQYIFSFNQLIGEDLNYIPDLKLPAIEVSLVGGIQEYYQKGAADNFELNIATATLDKSKLGISAAKKAYIPELSYFAQYNYNHGIPLYPEQYLLTGLNLSWTLIAFGERSALVKQRNALYNEAAENLEYRRLSVQTEIHQAYRNIIYAESLIKTAFKAYEAREEEMVLTNDAVEAGEALPSMIFKAKADLAGAKADKLAAELNYQIAIAKLQQLIGK